MLKDAIYNLKLDKYLHDEEIILLNSFRGCIEPWVIVNLLCYMDDYQPIVSRATHLNRESVVKTKGFPTEEEESGIAKRNKAFSIGYYLIAAEQFKVLLNMETWSGGLSEQRFFNYLQTSSPFFSLQTRLQPYLVQQFQELQNPEI